MLVAVGLVATKTREMVAVLAAVVVVAWFNVV